MTHSSSELTMQGIDVFLNTYVRLDEGTAVLLCAHRTYARTAAWIFTALVTRGADADALCFDEDDESTGQAITERIAALRASRGTRRVAVIVCEPSGPSFRAVLTAAQGRKPERTPVFRVAGRASDIFDLGFQPAHPDAATAAVSEESDDDGCVIRDADIARLAEMTDEELVALAELSDDELEELAATLNDDAGFQILA
jgi:hypothetical protein